jgi:site-specific DNA-methyltransferase (adenine-specific)
VFDRLRVGDCVDGLRQLPAGVVDLAFADPPFNIGYQYDIYEDKKACDEYLDWCRIWIGELHRVLKPSGAFWLAIGDEYAAELKVTAHREVGFHLRSWVVWYYTFGVNCAKKFTRSHAHLFYFVKDAKEFTFHDEAIRVPSARQLVYADKRANPKGRIPDDTWILRPQEIAEGFQLDHDTWCVSRVCGTFAERAGWHGCQMPEKVLGRIVRSCSSAGDVVLDPFAGSGTTLAVAKKLDRRYLGFELSAEYAERASERLAGITIGDPLTGGPDPEVAAAEKAWRAQREGGARRRRLVTTPRAR